MDWYELMIEEEIRPVVRLLRDNGFNTVYSCGHAMVVEMHWYDNAELTHLYNLLVTNRYLDFLIDGIWMKGPSYAGHAGSKRYLSLYIGQRGKETYRDNLKQRGKKERGIREEGIKWP